VSFQSKASPEYVSLTPSNTTGTHPILYQTLETTLHDYTFFDPSDSIYADAFGFSVYSYALAQNAASPMTLELFKNSTEDIFTTLYAGLADSQLFQQGNSPRTAQGALSTSVTRLFVVSPDAWVILGVVFLILVCNAFLFIYAARNYSILRKNLLVCLVMLHFWKKAMSLDLCQLFVNNILIFIV
jgi:hypothetical protein